MSLRTTYVVRLLKLKTQHGNEKIAFGVEVLFSYLFFTLL